MTANLRYLRWGSALALTLCALLVGASASAQYGGSDLDWPRQLDADFGEVVIYQPQLESYSGNTLEARAAVSVTRMGETAPTFGAVWIEGRLVTDVDADLAWLESVRVTAAKFPDADRDQIRELSRYLEEEIPEWEMVLSKEQLIASMDDLDGEFGGDTGLRHDAPEVIFATHPTVLVTIDGEPVLEDLEGHDVKYVLNTPFYMLRDPRSYRYYLRGSGRWYTTTGDVTGKWTVAERLPGNLTAIAEEIERDEREREADWEGEIPPPYGDEPPEVIVRTKPAELIQTNGEPEFAPIEGTQLLYVRNTESDVLMDIASQQYFVLLSGRWYTSGSLEGGMWTHVPPDGLPADFAAIPSESDMGNVRASVAGTQEAREAALENSVPQTAEVDRHSASLVVTYDGSPRFERCAGGVAYAVNTEKSVLLVDGVYYCCDEAIWFVSDYPDGPWEVATWLPEEIRDIPPDCPVYNVRYVYIYDYTPDVVYVGYTPGYLGSYVYHGCIVYGTGYWYDPWYDYYYYPRPCTWGFGAHWNPFTGWGFCFGLSYHWVHCCPYWRPWHHWGWWGPGGYVHGYRHGYYQGYHHGYHDGFHHGVHAGYRPAKKTYDRNLYRVRPEGIVKTGTKRPNTGHFGHVYVHEPKTKPSASLTPSKKKVAELSPLKKGRQAAAPIEKNVPELSPLKKPKVAEKPNDVFTDKKGNVYRKEGDTWQKRDTGKWSPTPRAPKKELERADASRKRADAKARKKPVIAPRKVKSTPAEAPKSAPTKTPKSQPPKEKKSEPAKEPKSQPPKQPKSPPPGAGRG
jgi:hypothetical protein